MASRSEALHLIMVHHTMAIKVKVLIAQEEEAVVEEEDTKKLSKPLQELVFLLEKVNHKLDQAIIIQPTTGREP